MLLLDKIGVSELNKMIPRGLVFVEQHGPADPNDIYAEELALVANAVDKRKLEFASGRSCAKKALSALGIRNFPVLATSNRAPIWPAGIIGSITHTDGYCAVVVGNSKDCASVGIDAEVVGRIDKNLWPLLFTEYERNLLNNTSARHQDIVATVMFGAKESFFKFQFPLTGKWLDFLDVTVTIDNASISINTNQLGPLSGGSGKYCFRQNDNIVITLITVPSGIR